jgi:hypothetical protein
MRTASAFLDMRLDAADLFIPILTGDAMLFPASIAIDLIEERWAVNGSDLLLLSANLPLVCVSVEKLIYKSSEPISIVPR